ncbi:MULTISPECIES: hypothetical protein [Phenylobacterium]|uniref:Uncharacterized protein n=1 Tax=Phenylobacterium koreense TaxID=266125 RepID=A0ABV2EIG8_9CAUL
MPDKPRSYSPTTQEANRARQQGAGMGQRDLDQQASPGRPEQEPRSFDTEPNAALHGSPANLDAHDLEEDDNPQLDWGEADPDALHGQTHTRRPVKTEASRGQGRKTRARNKQIVSGKPYG